MSIQEEHWLSFEDPDDYDRMREVLLRTKYTVPGVLEVVGLPVDTLTSKHIPELMERTAGGRPIDTLMRLFLARVPVDEQMLRDAIAPMALETWERIGLVRKQNGSIVAALKFVPFDRFWITQEIHDPSTRSRGDFVIGVGGATLTVMNFMLRRRTRLTLDLGTGTGILALIKAGESDSVIATDQNPRAVRMAKFNMRINELSNVDCREGDLFEPVAGMKFDFILSNAPFVISPSSGYMYLDGGMQGDRFVQRLVRGAAEALNEGGYCQFLCNWAHVKGQDSQERLAGWFKGTGCDVWILRADTDETSEYAKRWIRHFEPKDSSDFDRIYDEWMSFYARENIEAISMGFVTMRRRQRAQNWFRVEPEPAIKKRDLGEDIALMFELQDYLDTLPNDDSLMNAVLRAAPELQLQVLYETSPDGWRAQSHQLQLIKALGFVAKADELTCVLVGKCNGKRNVRDILSELGSISGLSEDQIKSASMHLIRHLIQRGFLIPA
jgi:methylase of polypeptide subunit release factors